MPFSTADNLLSTDASAMSEGIAGSFSQALESGRPNLKPGLLCAARAHPKGALVCWTLPHSTHPKMAGFEHTIEHAFGYTNEDAKEPTKEHPYTHQTKIFVT